MRTELVVVNGLSFDALLIGEQCLVEQFGAAHYKMKMHRSDAVIGIDRPHFDLLRTVLRNFGHFLTWRKNRHLRRQVGKDFDPV